MLFKCIHTGNTVEFLQEHDIKDMLRHPEYVQVIEEEVKPQEVKKVVKAKTTK